MASLWKHPQSKYLVACFTAIDGRQLKRSTKQTDRAKAMRVALALEEAHRNRLTEDQIRRVMSDLCEQVTGRKFRGATVADYFRLWLENKTHQTAASTMTRYQGVIDRFLAFLGPERASAGLHQLGVDIFSEYRAHMLSRVSRQTVALGLKILGSVMKSAWQEGFVTENPMSKVSRPRAGEDDERARRPFRNAELQLILDQVDDEWRGMILTGYYTGQRLGDIAGLRWQNVDVERAEIRFVTQKTRRTVNLPMAKCLLAYFLSLPAVDDLAQPVFPKAARAVKGSSRTGTLSKQFNEILCKVGLAAKREQATGKAEHGRGGRRKQSPLSFHSLRHTMTSTLKSEGVGDAVAMDIVGHESEAISRQYTHIDDEAKRRALDKLPEIWAPAKREKK